MKDISPTPKILIYIKGRDLWTRLKNWINPKIIMCTADREKEVPRRLLLWIRWGSMKPTIFWEVFPNGTETWRSRNKEIYSNLLFSKYYKSCPWGRLF